MKRVGIARWAAVTVGLFSFALAGCQSTGTSESDSSAQTGSEFDQGAGVVCNLDLWLPANGATSHRLRVLQIVFTGRGKQRNAGGANNPVVSMELDIRSVLIQERSSVGDDAWAISDAVEFTTMFDEDDTDDAGE